MTKFAKVSRFKDVDIPIPVRATANSAGYDFVVAEDTVIPPLDFQIDKMRNEAFSKNRHKDYYGFVEPFTLDEVADFTKELKAKPTLVSTGMKCFLEPDQYLKIVARSSLPLKHWLIVANSEAIIDSDYIFSENEGEIFIQLINLSPFAIQLKRGERIAQGIIRRYELTDNDNASGIRRGGLGSSGN